MPRAEFPESVSDMFGLSKGENEIKGLQMLWPLIPENQSTVEFGVFGRRMGVTQPSHRMTDCKAGFLKQKENASCFHSSLTPLNFPSHTKASKAPPTQTTPVIQDLFASRCVHMQCVIHKIALKYTRTFPRAPSALP